MTIDTNILIPFLEEDPLVVSWLSDRIADRSSILSVIVEAEVLAWSGFSTERRRVVEHFLERHFRSIAVDRDTARIAADIRRRYGLKLPDACIAATAIRTKTKLLTRNIKDFLRVKELRVQSISWNGVL